MTPRQLFQEIKLFLASLFDAIGEGISWLWNKFLDTPIYDILKWVVIGIVAIWVITSVSHFFIDFYRGYEETNIENSDEDHATPTTWGYKIGTFLRKIS